MDMDFAISCPLVRRWRLVSGFCPSTRTFDPCFFQTPPRGGSPCIITSGSLLESRYRHGQVVVFLEGWRDSDVLPTLGTTELFQSQRFGESLLRKGLLGEHCGHPLGSLVAERWVKQDELLNLAEFGSCQEF